MTLVKSAFRTIRNPMSATRWSSDSGEHDTQSLGREARYYHLTIAFPPALHHYPWRLTAMIACAGYPDRDMNSQS